MRGHLFQARRGIGEANGLLKVTQLERGPVGPHKSRLALGLRVTAPDSLPSPEGASQQLRGGGSMQTGVCCYCFWEDYIAFPPLIRPGDGSHTCTRTHAVTLIHGPKLRSSSEPALQSAPSDELSAERSSPGAP